MLYEYDVDHVYNGLAGCIVGALKHPPVGQRFIVGIQERAEENIVAAYMGISPPASDNVIEEFAVLK
jgi:hypothetical protein